MPAELAAYKAAKLHMVVYPGQAIRQTLVEALHSTLIEVCANSVRARPGVWRAHLDRRRWVLTEL